MTRKGVEMDIERIKDLLELIEESETEEFEIEFQETDGSLVKIRKGSPDGYSFCQVNSGNIGKALAPDITER
jgi:predicted Zn-dependent protease